MVEESGVVPTRQETTCKTGLRLIGRLGDGSKWVVDESWLASMLKGKEKGRRGQKRTGKEREREGGGKERKGKERKGTLFRDPPGERLADTRFRTYDISHTQDTDTELGT